MTTPAGRGDPRALALGPGYLFTAPMGTDEPEDLTLPGPPGWEAVSPNWVLLGYTETGSEFNYALTSGNVEVAEELDPVLISTTGRTSTVAFTMAEMTASNLAFAMNGGEITVPGTGDVVIVEPPDLGTEVRVMIGFESEDHTERWVYRQCFQTGTMKIIRQKGTVLAGIAVTFSLEKPGSGRRLYAAIFDRVLRGGWSPQIPPAVPVPPTITSLSVAGGLPAGGYPTVITGTGLRGATGVTFGAVPATGLTPTGTPDTTLQCTVPAGTGTVDVTVTTPAGSDTLTGGFTYALTATTVTPAAAVVAGVAADPADVETIP